MPNSTLTSISHLASIAEIPDPTEPIVKSAEPSPAGQEVTQPPISTFPEIIDNTRRSSWTHCHQQFFRGHVQNLRSKGALSVHLHAGGAFARGMEITRKAFYGEKLSPTDAEAKGEAALIEAYGDFVCPEQNANKSLPNLLRGFESYWMEYPLATDRVKPFATANGEPAVEFTFAIPIPGTKHPVTGDPLLYAGRFDMLGCYNGQLFAVDEKTAGSLGDQWRRQWDLDSQFTGYCWAAQQYGYKVAGAIIRGVGLLKTKITHAEAIVYRPQWQIDRWLRQLQTDCDMMVRTFNEYEYCLKNPVIPADHNWDYALDKAHCDAYSGCAYKLLCSTPEPETWISNYYEVGEWDPLAKL